MMKAHKKRGFYLLIKLPLTDSTQARIQKEPCAVSKMEGFAKISNGFKSTIFLLKRSILDAWQGSEYASGSRSNAEQKKSRFIKYFMQSQQF